MNLPYCLAYVTLKMVFYVSAIPYVYFCYFHLIRLIFLHLNLARYNLLFTYNNFNRKFKYPLFLELVEKYLKFDQSEQTELYGLWLLANLLTEKIEFVTGEII